MQKKVLSEIGLYYGDVAMPKYWEIDRNELAHHILHSNLTNEEFSFSKTFDKLNTYIRDHINLKYSFNLINKKTWGDIYKPQEISIPLLNIEILPKGSIIVFPSFLWHRVKPVTRGVRYSLVLWHLGYPFK
jgi:hypothetical protein